MTGRLSRRTVERTNENSINSFFDSLLMYAKRRFSSYFWCQGSAEMNLQVENFAASHKFSIISYTPDFGRLTRHILSNRFGAIIFATSSDQITQSHNLENGVVFHEESSDEFMLHLLVFGERTRSFCLALSTFCALVWCRVADKKGESSDDRRPFPFPSSYQQSAESK